jgi:hypothetical protein
MGDLERDTAVEPVGPGGQDRGHFRAVLNPDWEIWGPAGGYLATIALRAVGAHTAAARPASLCCHYLSVPRSGPVEVWTETAAGTARAEAVRVRMVQEERPVLDAQVWAVGAGLSGPDRPWRPAPDVPGAAELGSLAAEADAAGLPPIPFWRNLEVRAVPADRSAGLVGPEEPTLLTWQRFQPRPSFTDPWTDAGRSVIIIDVGQFPAVTRGFRPEEARFVAPSLDVYVAFHDAAPEAEWLLSRASGVAAGGGLFGGEASVWAPDGRLLATGAQQMLVGAYRGSLRAGSAPRRSDSSGGFPVDGWAPSRAGRASRTGNGRK